MSLWSKPIEEVTYEDLEAFCIEGVQENIRLDYKETWPKKLSKSIAAFANTLGGLILIGVKEPLPAGGSAKIAGVEKPASATEKVTQAGQALYPSVAAEVTRPLMLPDGVHAAYVIRVYQSGLAPHADITRNRVFVRTGDTTQPEDLADIDRIQLMLYNREAQSALRDKEIQRALNRFRSLRSDGAESLAHYWCCVSPQFLLGDILTRQQCLDTVGDLSGANRMRVSGGALAYRARQGKSTDKVLAADQQGVIVNVTTFKDWQELPDARRDLCIEWLVNLIRETALTSHKALKISGAASIGRIAVSIGCENVRGTTSQQGHWETADHTQIDNQIRIEEHIDFQELGASIERGLLRPYEHRIAEQISHAFGHPSMPAASYLK